LIAPNAHPIYNNPEQDKQIESMFNYTRYFTIPASHFVLALCNHVTRTKKI